LCPLKGHEATALLWESKASVRSSAFGTKRTCRERPERADLTKMIHTGIDGTEIPQRTEVCYLLVGARDAHHATRRRGVGVAACGGAHNKYIA